MEGGKVSDAKNLFENSLQDIVHISLIYAEVTKTVISLLKLLFWDWDT